jgi:hypothetical protein
MEVVAEEAGPTRQLRRECTLTTKALELEGTKRGGKSGEVISIATPSQRSSDPREWNESDEYNSDDGIEVRPETPDAPRPSRVRQRPRTPSRPTAGGNIGPKTTKGDPLSTILAAIEELKNSNAEIKATNAELSAGARQLLKELAEVRNRLSETQTQLSETQTQLSETQTQLAETQTQLAEIGNQAMDQDPELQRATHHHSRTPLFSRGQSIRRHQQANSELELCRPLGPTPSTVQLTRQESQQKTRAKHSLEQLGKALRKRCAQQKVGQIGGALR